MKFNTNVSLLVVTIIILTWDSVDGKRILIVSPTPMYSHQIAYRALWSELHKRGHELVIVTAFHIEDPNLKNYTEIYFGLIREKMEEVNFNDGETTEKIAQEETRMKISELCHFLTEKLLEYPDLRKLYVPESKEKFDAVIVETLFSPVFYLLGHRFDAPLIGILSMQLHNSDRYFIGSPIISSHLSNWETEGITEYPTFWERLSNFIDTWYLMYRWYYGFLPIQESIARKYFGDNFPSIIEAGKNMSLLLSNSHALNLYARPDVPTVVYYNSGQIMEKPPSLPTDLLEFLDNATNGFIYMSFGTTFQYKFLSKRVKALFLNVFSKLPWPIVWKREEIETIQRSSYLPNKIYFSNWVPQQGILAHPNIKLFIYQGGLQSTEEAMYYGIPLLGIPLMFDQEHNVKKIMSYGVGKHLSLATLTETNVRNAIYEIIQNKSYKEKMLEISDLSKDLPYDPLMNAVWWIEHVMRTKGAPHLQSNEKYKPLYQQYNVDIIAFLVIVTNLILVILLCLTIIFLWYVIKRSPLIYLKCLLKKRKEKLR